MLTSIKGTYRDGRVELSEDPHVVGEVTVVVTFLESISKPPHPSEGKIITSGMLRVPGRPLSTEEDFKLAEYDDAEWDHE